MEGRLVVMSEGSIWSVLKKWPELPVSAMVCTTSEIIEVGEEGGPRKV
jgi:hypothetical protein